MSGFVKNVVSKLDLNRALYAGTMLCLVGGSFAAAYVGDTVGSPASFSRAEVAALQPKVDPLAVRIVSGYPLTTGTTLLVALAATILAAKKRRRLSRPDIYPL